MAWNAHRVFDNSIDGGSFSAALKVSDDQESILRGARDQIRDALRSAFANWAAFVGRDVLFAGVPAWWNLPSLRPKFRMQGSFAYRTHVEPAHIPPQEIDLDDGLFLPVAFADKRGKREPLVDGRGLFLLVQLALEPLCLQMGWRLNTSKSSCVRVELPNEHIDIAIYAISDEQFAQLIEKAALAADANLAEQTRSRLRDSMNLDDILYRSFGEDDIALAHREQGWKRSDPRKLDQWFHERLAQFDEVYRRVCRYLKGWRDFQFAESRLASIALMAATSAVFAEEQPSQNRDDDALRAVAARLPEILAGRIANPVVDGERLDEGWTVEERRGYVDAARRLNSTLTQALESSRSASEVISSLQQAFGDRIPNNEDLVTGDAVVLEYKSAALAAPAIPKLSEPERVDRLSRGLEQASSKYRAKPWAERLD